MNYSGIDTITLTITLPETYKTLKSITIGNVWTNDGGAGSSVVLGASYNSSAVIVNGTSGWGGAWVGASFTAGSDMIAAAAILVIITKFKLLFIRQGRNLLWIAFNLRMR